MRDPGNKAVKNQASQIMHLSNGNFSYVQASSFCRSCYLGHVYTGPDKFLHRQNFARFHLALTWDRRNWFLSVQGWDLKKARTKLVHLAVQKSVQFHRSHVNTRWNHASLCPCKNSDPCERGLTVDYQATNGDYQKPLPTVYLNLCELVSFTRSILLVNIPLCHIIDLLFNLFDKNQGHRKADQPKFRLCSTFTGN